jgi:hypothetical protein
MRMSVHFWNSSKSVTKVLVLTTSAQVAPDALRHRSRFLERLFHLRPHVAFADTVAIDIAGQLAGGVDDLAGTAHRHDMRVGRLSARHPDIHAFRLKPLDLKDHSTLLLRFDTMRPALAHNTTRRDSGLVQGPGKDLKIAAAGDPAGLVGRPISALRVSLHRQQYGN